MVCSGEETRTIIGSVEVGPLIVSKDTIASERNQCISIPKDVQSEERQLAFLHKLHCPY
jgi:hypothetical protein